MTIAWLRQAGAFLLILTGPLISGIAHASIEWKREYPSVSAIHGENLVTPMYMVWLVAGKRFLVLNVPPNDQLTDLLRGLFDIPIGEASAALQAGLTWIYRGFNHIAEGM